MNEISDNMIINRISQLISVHKKETAHYYEILEKLPSKNKNICIDLLEGILKHIEEGTQGVIILYSPMPTEVRNNLFQTIFASLEKVLNYIDYLLRNAKDVPLISYYIVDYYLLIFKKDLKYIIVIGDREQVSSLKGFFTHYLDIINPTGAISELLEQIDLTVLDISRRVVENPRLWSVLFHEVSHALDRKFFKVTDHYYPHPSDTFSYPPPGTLDMGATAKNWASEYFADIISTKIIGPIFPYALLEQYAPGEERYWTMTHPPTSDRINEMCNILESMGLNEYSEKIKNQSSSYISSPARETIENIVDKKLEISGKVDEICRDVCLNDVHEEDLEEKIKEIVEDLKNWKPRTDCVRLVFNAIINLNPPTEMLEFIGECIRLSLIKEQHIQRTEKLLSEQPNTT